jgi:hypothetical protein
MARMQKMVSTAPAPPSRWPIALLVEDIETLPMIAEQALHRAQLDRVGHGRGAMGVDIVDVGRVMPAFFSAISIERKAPKPSGCGAVT